ncbi:uncharacterized protein [Apostichopus japonicus]|uniref:uncharacterized protein n=1 Tax=Stichopus japonicus TaxID=307972 RepID=UPI003AB14AEB
MIIQPFEDEDITKSEDDFEDEISNVDLADLPEEGLVDKPAARPSLLLRCHFSCRVQKTLRSLEGSLWGLQQEAQPPRGPEKWTSLVEDNEDRSNCCGEWLWEDFTEDVPFINENVNFAFETEGSNSELDFLSLFLTKPVLKNFVDQTNRYASQEGVKTVDCGGKYIPVTRESFMAYIGLTIAMGLTNKSNIGAYWSTNQILQTPWFPQVMPCSLYQQSQRYLHVSDNKMEKRLLMEGSVTSCKRSVRYLIPCSSSTVQVGS